MAAIVKALGDSGNPTPIIPPVIMSRLRPVSVVPIQLRHAWLSMTCISMNFRGITWKGIQRGRRRPKMEMNRASFIPCSRETALTLSQVTLLATELALRTRRYSVVMSCLLFVPELLKLPNNRHTLVYRVRPTKTSHKDGDLNNQPAVVWLA